MTLKTVEPLIEGRFKGAKGTVEGAAAAAVEKTLHEQPYQEAELENLIGVSLSSLFEGNNSQLKSVAYAKSHGESLPPCLSPKIFKFTQAVVQWTVWEHDWLLVLRNLLPDCRWLQASPTGVACLQ